MSSVTYHQNYFFPGVPAPTILVDDDGRVAVVHLQVLQ
jgi:hypothetical protein